MKKTLSVILALALLLSAAIGFAEGDVKVATLLSTSGANDSNTEAVEFRVNKFNEAYAGQYEVKVEWIPGAAEDIRTKLKMLNSSGSLPTIVTQLGAEAAFADLMIKNNRLLDFKAQFDADAEWKDACIPESIAYNTTEDGKMFSAPSVSSDAVGIYYNKEFFASVGYDHFPTTWDEFWDACDKLKAAGITPIALHTTETAWCPMLVAEAYVAKDADAQSFYMDQIFPTDYNVPAVEKQLELMKKLFTYSTPDAVGGRYALAANNFCSGKTAMIPNGPWMIESLYDTQYSAEGFADKVGYARYPGDVMVGNMGISYGDAISMDVSAESQEAGLAALRFFSIDPEVVRYNGVHMGQLSTKITLLDEDLAQLNSVMQEYVKAYEGTETFIINYQGRLDPVTQNTVFTNELPNYVTGNITTQEMMQKMTDAGTQYAEDNE